MQEAQRRVPEIRVDREIGLAEAAAVARGTARIVLEETARARCRGAEARLADCLAEARHVYGLTTGFGPLANRLVSPDQGTALQENLIRHLASGTGAALDWDEARAMVLARLMSILQGYSGASETAIAALVAILDSDLAPEIPSRGTVGASGDLTPLAHMVLCLQGQGRFLRRDGTRVGDLPAPSLDLARRDGLALVNGTSAMTGIAALNAADARRLCDWTLALTAALAEVTGGRTEAWHPVLARIRPHPGQIAATRRLGALIRDSGRLVAGLIAERRLDRDDFQPQAQAGQDAYSLRCAPQLIGAVLDTLGWHDEVVARELCAVTDNPVFPPEEDGVAAPAVHGGNFMGSHVGLASDALSSALITLAGLTERQVARVTDERLNVGLPAFLCRAEIGLHSGLMGAQVTATALLAEMRAGAGSASIQSISTNGANQDVVSMGTIAARSLRARLQPGYEIAAILALAVAQGMEIRAEGRDLTEAGFSRNARALHGFVRRQAPELLADRSLSAEILAQARAMRESAPPAACLGEA